MKGGKFSKEFLGVSIGTTNITRTIGEDKVNTSGTMNLTFNGKNYSAALTEPEGPQITETGAKVTTGNISIPASQLSSGASFPTVKVS